MNRRALLKTLAGAVGASVLPSPIAKPMTIGVDMAKDHALDSMRYSMRYVALRTCGTGFTELVASSEKEIFGFTVQGGERVTTTKLSPKA